MSRQRMLVSYGAMLAIVTLAAWSTLISFPIVGQAEIAAPAAIQTPPGTNEEGFVVRRNAIRYPADAVERGVEGEVVVDLTFNADGAIIDSDVISGPEELRQAGLQSALINGYNISTARTLQVIVDFSLNENGEAPRPNRIIEEIQVLDLTDPDLTALRTRLAPYVGRSETDVVAALPDIIAQITPDPWWLSIGSGASGGGLVNIHFSEVRRFVTGSTAGAPPPPPPPPPPASAGERLRVAAGVSQGNLLQQVPPEYPPLAREARIQGLVLLETIIGRDGRVQSARILTGHPLLAPAAADAVLQWVYRPTLLNGQPVEIVTTVSVTFSLN